MKLPHLTYPNEMGILPFPTSILSLPLSAQPLLFWFHLYFIWPEGSSGRTPSASWEWGVLVVQALFKPMSPASSPWGRGPTRESPEMRESVSGALGDILAATALLASPKPTFRELWFSLDASCREEELIISVSPWGIETMVLWWLASPAGVSNYPNALLLEF